MHSFEHTAIGNLMNGSEMRTLRVPRSHMFVTDISVGTPPQPMKCLVDSGSADFWIPSRRCKTCKNVHHFRADQSSSFMPAVARTVTGPGRVSGLMPVPVRVSYSRNQGQRHGEVVGFLVQDKVHFGMVAIENQSFVIVEEAKLPQHRSWDGICGLGWKRMLASGTGQPLYKNFKPMYKNLEMGAGGGAEAVITLVPSPAGQAYIVAGQVPFATCKAGTLVWVQAEILDPTTDEERSFWAASGRWYVLDSPDSPRHYEAESMRFLIDTASSFILVPPREYLRVVRGLFPPGVFDKQCGVDQWADNQVVCLCSVEKSMKQFHIVIEGHEFELTADMLFKRVPARNGGELCLLMVQQNPMTSTDPLELLGDLLGGTHGPPEMQGSEGTASPTRTVEAPFMMPPLPFLMPMSGAIAGLMNGRPDDGAEEVVQTMADGSICTTRLIFQGGTLQKNVTSCRTPEATTGRRLSREAEAEANAVATADAGNFWVLGAPFLERFVVILDYERARLGVAELAGETDQAVAKEVAERFTFDASAEAQSQTRKKQMETTWGGRSRSQTATPATPAKPATHSWGAASTAPGSDAGANAAAPGREPQTAGQHSPWPALAVLALVVALGGCAATHAAKKLRRRKNFSAPIDDCDHETGIHTREHAENDPLAAE